jgi:hypothetical protein
MVLVQTMVKSCHAVVLLLLRMSIAMRRDHKSEVELTAK